MIKLILDKRLILWRPLVLVLLIWLCMSWPALAAESSSVEFFVTPNPLSVQIKKIEPVGGRHHSSKRRRYRLSAVATNNGSSAIGEFRVRIILPPDITVKKYEKKSALLSGNKSKKYSWILTALESGDYLVQIKATGVIMESGQTVSAVTSQNISLAQNYTDDDNYLDKKGKWLTLSSYLDLFKRLSFWRS